MPVRDRVKRAVQAFTIEIPAQAQDERNGVGGCAGSELLHEPQTFLGEGQGNLVVWPPSRDAGRPGGGAAAEALVQQGSLGVGEVDIA
ncbi:hypothetical protein GCM10022248_93880 [Nonomuraea soli]